jgi:hypothetical protein
MNTQVAFNIDAMLKKQFLQKAKKEGLTLKTFLSYCMKEYTNGGLGMKVISHHNDDDGNWETLIDLKKEWITGDELLAYLKKINK